MPQAGLQPEGGWATPRGGSAGAGLPGVHAPCHWLRAPHRGRRGLRTEAGTDLKAQPPGVLAQELSAAAGGRGPCSARPPPAHRTPAGQAPEPEGLSAEGKASEEKAGCHSVLLLWGHCAMLRMRTGLETP